MSEELFRQKAPGIMCNLMEDLDLLDYQAAGPLGNIGHECNGFSNFLEIGQPEGKGGYGWCQWTGPRRRAFMSFCRDREYEYRSDEANYGFLIHELKTSEKGALKRLRKTTSLEGAVESFMEHYERPGVEHLESRIWWGRIAMEQYEAARLAEREMMREGEEMSNVLTCVYCGMAYPEGTPPYGAQILTDHIKVCEKHPMREAEAKIEKLRKALAGLIGAETKEELEQMEAMMRIVQAPDHDKMVSINAIRALLETA